MKNISGSIKAPHFKKLTEKEIVNECQIFICDLLKGGIFIHIKIYKEGDYKFTIHPGEEFVEKITNLLITLPYCRITNSLKKAIGLTGGIDPDAKTDWLGLIDGFVVDDSHGIKDIAAFLAEKFEHPLYVLKEDQEYLITDDRDAVF